ncbi:MAG: RnfABCDGE type electron transport complex subunit G [bacterium]|nr:RnfABCDGE type electron transport complex subunit G [bacterium]
MAELFRLVLTLTLVSVVAGLALSGAEQGTKSARERQDREAKLEAIEAVLPPHDNEPDQPAPELDLLDGKSDGRIRLENTDFYVAEDGGQVVAVAFKQESGNGYSGRIEVMLGVDLEGTLTGIDVVKHLETPGLGSKIDDPEKGNRFKDQFKNKSLANSRLINGKITVKKDGGDIEAISGATISPRAVCDAVSKGFEVFGKVKAKFKNGG